MADPKPYPSRYGIAVQEVTNALRELLLIVDLHAHRLGDGFVTEEQDPIAFKIAESGGLRACLVRLKDAQDMLRLRMADLHVEISEAKETQ